MADITVRYVHVEKTDGESYRIPYWEVESGVAGPCVLVTATLHGNEVQGAEVVRELLPQVAAGLVRGSCLLVPFANPVAIQKHQPHIDFELSRYAGGVTENNVNCTWPGDAEGNNAQRLSHALFEALVGRATHNIDLHCWNCFWASTALAREGHEWAIRLAGATALRFAKRSEWRPGSKERPVVPCLLSSYFNDTGRGAMCVEFCGQYGIWHREVARGVRALTNCFRVLDMLPGEIEGQEDGPIWLNDAEMVEVPATCAGLFVRAEWHTSDWVDEGALLGHVLSDEDLSCVELRAPTGGYLYQYGGVHENTSEHSMMWTHPHVAEGEVVAKIVVASQSNSV